jgi:hypothetical protein
MRGQPSNPIVARLRESRVDRKSKGTKLSDPRTVTRAVKTPQGEPFALNDFGAEIGGTSAEHSPENILTRTGRATDDSAQAENVGPASKHATQRPIGLTDHLLVSGRISVTKPAGSRSWEIIIFLPNNTIYVSTPNLKRALAFFEELVGNATAAGRRMPTAGEDRQAGDLDANG